MKQKNLTMLTDFYELTMANGYFENGIGDKTVYFDMFFRNIPDDGGFAITAGLEQLIYYLKNLKFDDNDIEFLRRKDSFSEGFLNYLSDFQFSCDVWAIPEGTPVFPDEPVVIVRGPVLQAQLIETMVLLTMNHQSLIATKANRIVRAAGERRVLEFGARRAQGYDAAIYGARAAYIGGCAGTSCTIAEREFGIPALGTMAHSWVQMFDTEEEAFRAYARKYPDNCILLVDTYDTLQSGIPNAIKIFKEEVITRGYRPKGIRLDSGDLTYLSREARKMLDEAGLEDCKIVASSSLDEYIIKDLLIQGAEIDSFGVGERLITSRSNPVFAGVYKLAAVEEEDKIIPRIKVSENVKKINNPGFKKVWRFFDKESGKAIADLLTTHKEIVNEDDPYLLFDPEHTWKQKTVTDYRAKSLLKKIFEGGECVYNSPRIDKIRDYCQEQIGTLWDTVLRFENPHEYYVDLSKSLWDIKQGLLKKYSSEE